MDFEKKIKIESTNDFGTEFENVNALRDHDYCKNPKLEELMEPKSEEPDYFGMDRPSEISPEPTNFEYPEYLKLELVDDYDSNTVQSQTTIPRTRKCSVCSIIAKREYFIVTRSKTRQFIMILGAVLSGKMSISIAKSSLYAATLAACPNHYPDAADEILKVLNIRQINQLDSCSNDNKTALMKTVNLLSSSFTFAKLYEALLDYFRGDGSLLVSPHWMNKEPNHKSNPLSIETYHGHRCSICSLFHINQSPTSITSINRKLILMTGLVLNGKKTIEEAQMLLSMQRCYFCRHHSSEAIDSIFRALDVKNVDEMQTCFMVNKISVMSIFSSLSTKSSFDEFSKLLKNFIQKVNYVKN